MSELILREVKLFQLRTSFSKGQFVVLHENHVHMVWHYHRRDYGYA